ERFHLRRQFGRCFGHSIACIEPGALVLIVEGTRLLGGRRQREDVGTKGAPRVLQRTSKIGGKRGGAGERAGQRASSKRRADHRQIILSSGVRLGEKAAVPDRSVVPRFG